MCWLCWHGGGGKWGSEMVIIIRVGGLMWMGNVKDKMDRMDRILKRWIDIAVRSYYCYLY